MNQYFCLLVTLLVAVRSQSLSVFQSPPGCVPAVNCLYYYSWQVTPNNPSTLTFNFVVQTTGWAGIGFSTSGGMMNSDIMTASIDSNGIVTVVNRHALFEGTPNADSPNVNAISHVSGSSAGGFINVTFQRDRFTTNVASGQDFDLSANCNSYYVLFATGSNSPTFSQHANPGSTFGPYATAGQINICKTGNILAVASTLATSTVVTHASIMLVAWIMLSPMASFIARYLKKQLAPPRWFQVHYISQIIAVVLCIISYIIIKQKHGIDAGVHGQIGLAVLILAIIQVFLGIFRNQISGFQGDSHKRFEGDKGARRWIFNWLHWSIGRSLLPISMATIYLGLHLLNVPTSAYVLWYIAVGSLIAGIIICEVLTSAKPDSNIQLHLIALMTSALAGCAAAIIAVLLDQVQN